MPLASAAALLVAFAPGLPAQGGPVSAAGSRPAYADTPAARRLVLVDLHGLSLNPVLPLPSGEASRFLGSDLRPRLGLRCARRRPSCPTFRALLGHMVF